MRKRHRILALLAVNIVLLALLGVVLEVGFRAFAPPWLEARMKFVRLATDPDEFGSDRGWKTVRRDGLFVKFKPGSQFTLSTREYPSIDAHIDELGGRKTGTPPSGKALVPVLGDSFTFGIGVEDGEGFVSLLQRRFGVRLANLGVPGSCLPDQRFIAEQRHQELGEPRLYVIGFFLGNDLADIIGHASRLADRRKGEATKAAEPPPSLAWRINAFVQHSWLHRLYSLQYFKSLALNVVNSRQGSARAMDPVFELLDARSEQYMLKARSALRAELEALRELETRLKTRFVFVLIPDRYQVLPERRAAQAAYYGIPQTSLQARRPNQLLASELERLGFAYVDPTEALDQRSGKERFYYLADGHLTREGQAALTEAVAEPLRRWIIEAAP